MIFWKLCFNYHTECMRILNAQMKKLEEKGIKDERWKKLDTEWRKHANANVAILKQKLEG